MSPEALLARAILESRGQESHSAVDVSEHINQLLAAVDAWQEPKNFDIGDLIEPKAPFSTGVKFPARGLPAIFLGKLDSREPEYEGTRYRRADCVMAVLDPKDGELMLFRIDPREYQRFTGFVNDTQE